MVRKADGVGIFHGHLKRRVLSIGIAIVFALFIGYAINTFYPQPEYNDFCGDREAKFPIGINDEITCDEQGGDWTSYPEPRGEIVGFCDLYTQCNDEYQAELEPYNRNVFFVSLVIGLLTVVGAIFLAVESVSAGLMGGGFLLIFYGTLRYWGDLSDIWRTLMLGFALGVLVYVGYKKLK